MELFFSVDFSGGVCRLDPDESAHCVKVLRHKEGDEINVIDGEGTLYICTVTDASPKETLARVVRMQADWGGHPYRLNMAVCPTKNPDRYEYFAEKGTEFGLDVITPVIGERSERKVFKTDRLKRILLSASKQSLKGAVPVVEDAVALKDFIRAQRDKASLKLICCCYEGEELRRSVGSVLSESENSDIVILIGPEGDFSREELALAVECGFIPVHLGPSRLRTETAALASVVAVYYHYCSETAM